MSSPPNPSFLQKSYDVAHLRDLALDHTPQSLAVADALVDGNPLIYVNAAFERLTGYSSNEVVGRNCNFLNGPATSRETRRLLREATADNRAWRGVTLNYRKDGSQFWNELSIVPVDDGANGRYFVGVQVDVTERIALEASLRESQKMEALGKLSGGMAHDFNNMLSLIIGNAELIEAGLPAGSPLLDATNDIIEAVDGGSKLIARMLQFARGETEVSQSLEVNRIVRDVVALLSRTLGNAIQIEMDLSEDVGLVHVDKPLFENAIINLALNARDAMPGGGTIRFSTRPRFNVGPGLTNVAVVSVSDTGQGMDEETRQRAFEPFFTTKDDGRGTGLGLSMVYRFVNQSGGDATIDSVLGRGTAVNLILPHEGSAPKAPPVLPEARSVPHILVVDDDSKVRKMLAIHLTRAGYVIDEAANAEDALGLLRTDKFYGLIISDVRMGEGMSGIELVAAVRAERPTMPMMLITGFSDELDNPPSHIENVPILRKPFRSSELLAIVGRMQNLDAICG